MCLHESNYSILEWNILWFVYCTTTFKCKTCTTSSNEKTYDLKANTKNYLENCTSSEGFYLNASCSTQKNLYCAPTGDTAGQCSCAPMYYYDTGSASCVAQKMNSIACTTSLECRSDLNLSCSSGFCICPSNQYWSYISYMCSKLNYIIYKMHCVKYMRHVFYHH